MSVWLNVPVYYMTLGKPLTTRWKVPIFSWEDVYKRQFLESDERVTKTNVNKAGMKGTYEVFVVIDDIKYPCGVSIKC